MAGIDQVGFDVRLCPHVSVRVFAAEQWGVSHTYGLQYDCRYCGRVTHTEHRARDAG